MSQTQLEALWLKALMFALFGYALMGRGFAYLFVGELILVLGFLIFLPTGRFFLLFSDPVLLLWTAFALWGFFRTVPFLHKYRFDAMRDAVLWGYGVFALLVVGFVRNSSQISRALNAYRKFLFWYLPIVPILVLLSIPFRNYVPMLPWGNGINIIMLRGGETGVHMAAGALFLLLFSDRRAGSRDSGISIFRMIGFVGWTIAAMLILVLARAGFVAIAVPIALVSVVKARAVGWKVAALAVAAAVLGLTILSTDLITLKVHGRSLRSEQVLSNLTSIVGGGSKNTTRNTQDTKQWRLIWWAKIIRYTIFGPYRWTGKGFGINLAQEDGPPGISKEDTALRSPHNGSMTVLARMGIPGFLLWIALNAFFVFRLFKAYRTANRNGSRFWASVNLWILSYWLAAAIELSFDVYIEGPDGGVLFWSIIGLGIAAMRIQKFEARQFLVQSRNKTLRPNDSDLITLSA